MLPAESKINVLTVAILCYEQSTVTIVSNMINHQTSACHTSCPQQWLSLGYHVYSHVGLQNCAKMPLDLCSFVRENVHPAKISHSMVFTATWFHYSTLSYFGCNKLQAHISSGHAGLSGLLSLCPFFNSCTRAGGSTPG